MEFAPASIPLERRLQTFAVLYWISSILFQVKLRLRLKLDQINWKSYLNLVLFQGLLVTIVLLYLFIYTSYWWISVLYATWLVYDLDTCNRGGR